MTCRDPKSVISNGMLLTAKHMAVVKATHSGQIRSRYHRVFLVFNALIHECCFEKYRGRLTTKDGNPMCDRRLSTRLGDGWSSQQAKGQLLARSTRAMNCQVVPSNWEENSSSQGQTTSEKALVSTAAPILILRSISLTEILSLTAYYGLLLKCHTKRMYLQLWAFHPSTLLQIHGITCNHITSTPFFRPPFASQNFPFCSVNAKRSR